MASRADSELAAILEGEVRRAPGEPVGHRMAAGAGAEQRDEPCARADPNGRTLDAVRSRRNRAAGWPGAVRVQAGGGGRTLGLGGRSAMSGSQVERGKR